MIESPELLAARKSFVELIKEENYLMDSCKQSIRQHWNGKASGFADDHTQQRWLDYWAGWLAARKTLGDQL